MAKTAEEAEPTVEATEEEATATEEDTLTTEEEATEEALQPIYTLVMASQVSRANAEAFALQLSDAGFDEARVNINKKGLVRVVYGSYSSEEEAIAELRSLRRQSRHFSQAWVMKV